MASILGMTLQRQLNDFHQISYICWSVVTVFIAKSVYFDLIAQILHLTRALLRLVWPYNIS